jgi:hypothetical protein
METSGWDFLDKLFGFFGFFDDCFGAPNLSLFAARKKFNQFWALFPQLVTRVYHDDWDMAWNSLAGWVNPRIAAPHCSDGF